MGVGQVGKSYRDALLCLKLLGVTVRNKLTWLHISDIHLHPITEWRDSIARGGLLSYLAQTFDRNDSLRPDLIFCTGDIAYGEISSSPLSDQYEQAKTFLDELLAVCGRSNIPLAKDHLFVVPGNHDVNRKRINSHAQAALTQWAKAAPDHALAINQEINDYSQEFKDAIRRLDEYAQFVREYLPHQQDAKGRHCYTNIVDINGLKVGIAGFNSAWSCAGPEDDRTVWLAAEWQFNAALKEIGHADVRIGLVHHPVDWLNEADRDIATRRISTDFHFWLHGHSHNAWVVPAQSHVIIAAGAVSAQANNEFGINLVHINLSESQGTVDLHEHRAGGASWKVATVDSHAPSGHWPFQLPGNLRKPVAPPPAVPSLAVDGEEYFEEDMFPFATCSESQFLALVDKYSDNLPEDLRRIRIGEIVALAWEMIVFAPYFANVMITRLTPAQNGIAPVIITLCKASTGQLINPDELKMFLDTLAKEAANIPVTSGFSYLLLAMRMIKHVFYQRQDLANSLPVQDKLKTWATLEDDFLDRFCVDLRLRHLCNYISIPEESLKPITEACDRYLRDNQTEPLSYLYPLIASPLAAASNDQIDSVIAKINKTTQLCKDTIDCKWCITAWLRVAPLRDSDDEEIDYGDELRCLIDQFDSSLVRKSTQLQFIYLNSLLRSFVRSKSPVFLSRYEEKFLTTRHRLRPPQITHLQLEYASCLHIFCQYNDNEALRSLKIVGLATNREKPINNPLFSNPLIADLITLHADFAANNKLRGNLSRWLNAYTKNLCSIFAKPLIEQNHLRLGQFNAAPKVYQNRALFQNAVLVSLNSASENLSQYSPAFSAHSCASFELTSRGYHIALLKAYLIRALEADRYSLLRNAIHIARGLYYWHNYGPPIDESQVREYEEKFARLMEIGTTQPRLFWIYYAAAQFKERPHEQSFVNQLSGYFEHISNKNYQLALRKEEDVVLQFPDCVVDSAKRNAKNSLIAAVLCNELTNAEVWNVLGTTVFNNRTEKATHTLEQAANFYTAAKCFARSNKEYDQKYCYNYIRCNAMIFDLKMQPPDAFFVRDTAFYLRRPDAALFAFHKDCLKPFFDLVKRYWNKLSKETQLHVQDSIRFRPWVKASCQSAQDILRL